MGLREKGKKKEKEKVKRDQREHDPNQMQYVRDNII